MKDSWFFITTYCASALVGAMLTFVVEREIHTNNYNKLDYRYRSEVSSLLSCAVEQTDGKPGISYEDQIEFAKRAEIPTGSIIEGRPIDLHYNNIETSRLVEIIKSYNCLGN